MLRFDFDFDLSDAFQRIADAVEGFLAKDVTPYAGLDIKIMLTLSVYGWPSLDLGSPCPPF